MDKGYLSPEETDQKRAELLDQRNLLQALLRHRIGLAPPLATHEQSLTELTLRHQNQLAQLAGELSAVAVELTQSEARRSASTCTWWMRAAYAEPCGEEAGSGPITGCTGQSADESADGELSRFSTLQATCKRRFLNRSGGLRIGHTPTSASDAVLVVRSCCTGPAGLRRAAARVGGTSTDTRLPAQRPARGLRFRYGRRAAPCLFNPQRPMILAMKPSATHPGQMRIASTMQPW